MEQKGRNKESMCKQVSERERTRETKIKQTKRYGRGKRQGYSLGCLIQHELAV